MGFRKLSKRSIPRKIISKFRKSIIPYKRLSVHSFPVYLKSCGTRKFCFTTLLAMLQKRYAHTWNHPLLRLKLRSTNKVCPHTVSSEAQSSVSSCPEYWSQAVVSIVTPRSFWQSWYFVVENYFYFNILNIAFPNFQYTQLMVLHVSTVCLI